MTYQSRRCSAETPELAENMLHDSGEAAQKQDIPGKSSTASMGLDVLAFDQVAVELVMAKLLPGQ